MNICRHSESKNRCVARIRYLIHWVRLKSQQLLNRPVVFVPKELVWSQFIARYVATRFIKDAQELKKHRRNKACFDARSVKVKVSQLTVWLLPKYMSVKTYLNLYQLFNTLVTSFENQVVVQMQLTHASLQHKKGLSNY